MKDAEAGNPALNTSLTSTSPNRDAFFDALDKMPFDKVAEKFFPLPTFKNRLKNKLRNYTRKLKKLLKLFSTLGVSVRNWKTFLSLNIFSAFIVPKFWNSLLLTKFLNILSIVLGESNGVKTATARINLKNTNKNSHEQSVSTKVITLSYEYLLGAMNEENRLLNPLGFKVLNYRVDEEIVRWKS